MPSVRRRSVSRTAKDRPLSCAGQVSTAPTIMPPSGKAPHGYRRLAAKPGLEQYEPAFRDNAIDGAVLPRLTPDDLKDIGVTQVGHRRKLLNAIAALGDPAPAATPAAVDPISPTVTAAP